MSTSSLFLLFLLLITSLSTASFSTSSSPLSNLPHNNAHNNNLLHHNGRDNHSNHDNSSHDNHNNGSHDNHHEHHGIHVVSIHFHYVKQPFILSIFLLVVILAKIGFHYANFLSSWMPESCVLIILGVLVGSILHLAEVDTSSFYYIDPPIFFLFLLPPCILEASYGLHDQVFFQNLGTIIIYALLGTLLNFFLVGVSIFVLAYVGAMATFNISLIQCLLFASLIVAVDPVAVLAIFQEIGVNSVLYFLVFGESLLNDAVTVVLYNTVNTLNKMDGQIPASEIAMAVAAFFTVSVGGLLIGILFGVLTALVTRFTLHVRMVEPLVILTLAYASYLTAELFHFSGIISLIGCGLMQVQYSFHNISNNSSITIKYFAKMLSGACDCIIFMFLGIALVRDPLVWNAAFIAWSVFLCLFIRFIVTYGISFVLNRLQRKRRIGTREQFIMAYGGLRGAVAFCLVAMLEQSEHKDLFRTTTLVIIFFTVFIQGISIKPLVKCLKIEGEEEKIVSLYQEINSHVMDHLLLYIEEVAGNYGYNSLQSFLNNLNDKYLKKALQRDPFTKDEIIMELYQQIALQQHYESVYGVDTSSQMHLYKPEIIRKASKVFENSFMSLQAERLSQRLSRADSSVAEEALMGSATRRFCDAVLAVSPTKKQAFTRSESVDKPSVRKWKAASKKLNMRKSLFAPNTPPTPTSPDNLELHRLLTQSSQRDVFSRHSSRNLIDGDKSDLLLLLNEKQLRHNRFIVNKASTPALSRAESLEHVRVKKAKMSKHKTVDFDSKPYSGRFTPKHVVGSQGPSISVTSPTELAPLMPLKEEQNSKNNKLLPTTPSHLQSHSAPQSPLRGLSAPSSTPQQPQHQPFQPQQPSSQATQEPFQPSSPPPQSSSPSSQQPEETTFPPAEFTPPADVTGSKRSSFRRQNAGESH